jgi:conflict system STAND superfamily ATPase
MDEEARTAAGPEALAVTRGAAWPGCPYLGLMPFLERDARIYYGREELVTDLVRRITGRLGRAGILLVAGESGAGKSSLLRAGLMPRLAAGSLGQGSDRWPRRVIRPGGKPLRELAAALGDVANTDADSVYRSRSAAPAAAPMLVELAVRTATGRGAHAESGGLPDSAAAAEPRLVLVVDQFEEPATHEDERALHEHAQAHAIGEGAAG